MDVALTSREAYYNTVLLTPLVTAQHGSYFSITLDNTVLAPGGGGSYRALPASSHTWIQEPFEYNKYYYFSGSAAQSGLWPRPRDFVTTHNDAPQSIGPLWTSDQLVAETSTWIHTQQTSTPPVGFEKLDIMSNTFRPTQLAETS
jgi:hypothetical protein